MKPYRKILKADVRDHPKKIISKIACIKIRLKIFLARGKKNREIVNQSEAKKMTIPCLIGR